MGEGLENTRSFEDVKLERGDEVDDILLLFFEWEVPGMFSPTIVSLILLKKS